MKPHSIFPLILILILSFLTVLAYPLPANVSHYLLHLTCRNSMLKYQISLYRLSISAMLKLLRQPVYKPNVLILARDRRRHRAVAPVSRMTASVSQVASDPSNVPTPRDSPMRAAALQPIGPQHLLRSAAASSRATASVSRLTLDQLSFVKPNDRPSRQLRQPSTSEDATLTGLGRILENRAVLNQFTTESAKHHACVDIAEMPPMVSGGVFQTVPKQVPDFCVALNSLTREHAKPLAFMDTMLGGGPHSQPWSDHENLEESEKESMNDLVKPSSLSGSLRSYLLLVNLHASSPGHYPSTFHPDSNLFSTHSIQRRPRGHAKRDQLLLEGLLITQTHQSINLTFEY